MRGALPVARRLLLSIRGDRRTLGMVILIPAFIVYLVSEVFTNPSQISPILLGVFIFFLTYMLTAIGFLRERKGGTLERILSTPVSRTGIVMGYVLGFGILATVQAAVLLESAVYFLGVEFEHGIVLFFIVELLGAFSALGIGILLSLFAENEFQAIQFIPVVITPQVILGGTVLPVEQLPWYLEYPARVMPVTYLIEAMKYVVLGKGQVGDLQVSIAVLLTFTVVAVVVAGLVVRRAD